MINWGWTSIFSLNIYFFARPWSYVTSILFTHINPPSLGNPLTVKIKVVIVLTSMQSKLLHCRCFEFVHLFECVLTNKCLSMNLSICALDKFLWTFHYWINCGVALINLMPNLFFIIAVRLNFNHNRRWDLQETFSCYPW